jgi:hypothetical protein
MGHLIRRKRDLRWIEPSEIYETSPQLIKVHQGMRSLYISGKPIFNRDCLQTVSRQLHDFDEKTDKIHVVGVNSEVVDFNI